MNLLLAVNNLMVLMNMTSDECFAIRLTRDPVNFS